MFIQHVVNDLEHHASELPLFKVQEVPAISFRLQKLQKVHCWYILSLSALASGVGFAKRNKITR